MPNKTIYVAAGDLLLFEAAAARAGGLSPAIAAALRAYVGQDAAGTDGQARHVDGVGRGGTRGEGAMRMKTSGTVELEVREGAALVRTRFQGERVARFAQTHDLRVVTYEVYRTAKGQYALYTVDRPDWDRWSHDPSMWSDRRTWSSTFSRSRDRTLQVFPTRDELLQALPDDIADAAGAALDAPTVRELDI